MLTPLVHLRSKSSIDEGLERFNTTWRTMQEELPNRRTLVLILSSIGIASLIWVFFLAPALLAQYGNLRGYWGQTLIGLLSINVLFSLLTYGLVTSLLLTDKELKKEPSTKEGSTWNNRSRLLVCLLSTLILPGVVFAISSVFIAFRAWVTLRHFREGMGRFIENWVTLILRTDLTTEPEILPGLSDEHAMSFASLFNTFRQKNQDGLSKYENLLPLAIFVPSILYRLILKSSFWLYGPLIWIAANPRGLKRDKAGRLLWDASLARLPLDIIAAFVALISTVLLLIPIWDHEAYFAASTWATKNDFPAFWPLLAAGLDPTRLDLWYLLPGIAAVLSLIVFIWSWQVSARFRTTAIAPSQFVLWVIYKLNSLKNLSSFLTVLVGFTVLVIYYGDQCLLPEPLMQLYGFIGDADCNSPVDS